MPILEALLALACCCLPCLVLAGREKEGPQVYSGNQGHGIPSYGNNNDDDWRQKKAKIRRREAREEKERQRQQEIRDELEYNRCMREEEVRRRQKEERQRQQDIQWQSSQYDQQY